MIGEGLYQDGGSGTNDGKTVGDGLGWGQHSVGFGLGHQDMGVSGGIPGVVTGRCSLVSFFLDGGLTQI